MIASPVTRLRYHARRPVLPGSSMSKVVLALLFHWLDAPESGSGEKGQVYLWHLRAGMPAQCPDITSVHSCMDMRVFNSCKGFRG